MKIIQFITKMDVLGGAQMHVLELSKALSENGHEITVLASGAGELPEELKQYSIAYKQLEYVVVPINPLIDIRALFEIRKIIKKINPDVIALHSSKAGILGRLVGKSLNIPTIFTAHSWSFAGEQSRRKKLLYTFVEKWVGKYTHGVITVSEFDYDKAIELGVIPTKKMDVIHNGIHDLKSNEIRQRGSASIINMLMVARFAEPKDHMLLLKSLQQVQSKKWHLTLVGGGPLLEEVKRFVAQNQLITQVTFVGEDRNVAAQLQEADIFILISKSEGLPLSIIEAMREGIPVIASDVGGVSELIDHQKNGLLVKKGDEIALTEALNHLIDSEPCRHKLGKKARKKFISQFTFSIMYQRTEEYYRNILL